MAKEVFISYSSLNADEANAVCAALEATGVTCWIAPRDIAPGADWSECIITGIQGCRVFVLVLTAQSNASPQVKREVERAVHKDLPIIVFRLENLTLTPAMEYFISMSQWLDATARPLEQPLQLLCRTVQQAMQTSSAAPTPHPPPAAPGVAPAAVSAGNLPTHATAFVGREREVRQVRERLDEGARLVTLTGLGGIGKTRIALKVAGDRQSRYSGGTWWVDLSVLHEPERALPAIATTLGVREEPGKPLLEQMAQHLGQTDTLLVLDNFEHILAAAEDLDHLLNACPRLIALVTSRAPLNISTEHEVAVHELPAQEAVDLFSQRAKQVKAGFALDEKSRKSVEAICRHLDGIPLAIELAATQTRMLGVAQLEKQLSQRFKMLVSPYKDVTQRQRTLKAALDWSYDLLTEEQQQLFARLSLFRNGFTLEDAEAVCQLEDIYFGLAALREQSLLRLEESEDVTRFSMLETLREYGREKLQAASLLDTIAERHALYYADVAREEGLRLRETGGASALARLSSEADNLRSALDWPYSHGQVDAAAELVVNLRRFWENKGWLREGKTYLDQALQHVDRLKDPSICARVFRASGWFAYLRGDYTEAEALTQRCLDKAIQADLPDIQADALNNLAVIAQAQHCPDRAMTLMEQSVAILRLQGNEQGVADLLMNMGFLQSTLGNHDQARQHFDEARAIYERGSNVMGVAAWLCNQSDLALRQSNWKEAEVFADQSLQRFRQIDHSYGVAYALINKAEAAARMESHETVDSSVREAYTICSDTNLRHLIPILLVTHARSQIARSLNRNAIASLMAAQRIRALLDLPLTPEEKHEFAQMESDLRIQETEDFFRSAEAYLAGSSVEDIISQLFSLP